MGSAPSAEEQPQVAPVSASAAAKAAKQVPILGEQKEFGGRRPGLAGLARSIAEATAEPTHLPDERRKAASLDHHRHEASEIWPGQLYVSGSSVGSDAGLLQRLGIAHSVDFGVLARNVALDKSDLSSTSTSTGICIRDSPHEDITAFFYQVLDLVLEVHSRGRAVLLLCEKGVSRSCAFAVACLMHIQDLTFANALKMVTVARSCCEPNIGFQCQLLEWQKRREVWRKTNEDPGHAAIWRIGVHMSAPESQQCLVPKLCLEAATRQILPPSRALLNCRTAFVIVPDLRRLPLVLWVGDQAPLAAVERARQLVPQLKLYECIGEWPDEEIHESEEPGWFSQELERWGVSSSPVVFQDISYVARVAAASNNEPEDLLGLGLPPWALISEDKEWSFDQSPISGEHVGEASMWGCNPCKLAQAAKCYDLHIFSQTGIAKF